jgi:hypothetical protein
MLDLLSHLMIIGLATALEPVQVLTFIAVLSSTHGIRSGWAFIAGWLVSLLTVAFLTWVAAARISQYASDVTQRRGVRQATLIVEVVLGICLLLYALYRVRRHPGPVHPSRLGAPGTTLTTTHAAVVGLLIPPWPLIIAGAVDVLRSDVGVAQSFIAMAVFVAAATSTIAAMQLWAIRSPKSSMYYLARVRAWVEPHSELLVTIIAALVGIWLLVHALRRW